MDKRFVILLLMILISSYSLVAQNQEEEVTYFKERIKTLSSDEFGGRKPLTAYETKTIHYIADEFKKLGLLPANGESFFQPVREIASGAFRNCSGLISIEFPDTTIEIGGEAFLNAYSLQTVKLSKNITEIKGSTFENCTSLRYIEIPDNVTRIGGSAFRNCTSLSEVNISNNSKLQEIGSSAFRVCDALESIFIPSGIHVNERAFKESPTIIYNYENYNDYQ